VDEITVKGADRRALDSRNEDGAFGAFSWLKFR